MGRRFDVFATPVPPHGHFALVFTDITGRRQAEDALRESEQRFRQMADTAPAMLWVTNTDNQLEFISKGWFEQTGQTPDEVYSESAQGRVRRGTRARASQSAGADPHGARGAAERQG